MDGYTLYFAYGSNMALERLRARVSSAVDHCRSQLPRHRLAFHKVSQKDGTGKCDAFFTGDDRDSVHGVLYWIHQREISVLDGCEGRGIGYERRQVTVLDEDSKPHVACSYFATTIEEGLKPFDWYREHVLRGAVARSLPAGYIRMIEAAPTVSDPDPERRDRELAVYG